MRIEKSEGARAARAPRPVASVPPDDDERCGLALLDGFGVIRQCNADLLEIAGRPRIELIGSPACDVFPDLPLSLYSVGFNRTLVRNRFGNHEWRPHSLVRGNGSRLPVDLRLGLVEVERSDQAFVLEVALREAEGGA